MASILQSLFDKPDEHHARGATFVVFDVNGEYAKALMPLAKANGIGVDHVILDGTASEGRFRLPIGFLNSPNGSCCFRLVSGHKSPFCEQPWA